MAGGLPAKQNMNSLIADMRRAIAYFLDMRSLAAMSLVDHTWYMLLSDRRVRNRTRVRCMEEGLPTSVNFYRGAYAPDTEHWYHLVAIGHEVRLAEKSLTAGYYYVLRVFTKAAPVFKAWKALGKKFETVRGDFDSCACVLYPKRIPEYAKLWPCLLMYLGRERVDPAIERFTDFDFLGLFERYDDVDRCPASGTHRCGKRKRRRGAFRDDELRACAAFLSFFRESLRLWQLYFAEVELDDAQYSRRVRGSLSRTLPTAIDRLEKAIDGARL